MSQNSKLKQFLKQADDEVLIELAEMTGVTRSSFVQGDPLSTTFNEGIRSIGLKLLTLADQPELDIIKKSAYNRYRNRQK